MFGINYRNFTRFAFFGKIGKFTFEFSAGVVEEVTHNITASVANAAEIPQNVEFISTNELATGASTLVASKMLKTHLVNVITAATPNLL